MENHHILLSLGCRLSLVLLYSDNNYFISVSWPLPRHISAFPPFILIEAHMMLFLCFYVPLVLLCCQVYHVSLSFLFASISPIRQWDAQEHDSHTCLSQHRSYSFRLHVHLSTTHETVTFTISLKSHTKFHPVLSHINKNIHG